MILGIPHVPRLPQLPFTRSESGAITTLGLFLFLATLMVAGLAMDLQQLMTARTQLQIAADATAHTALYARDTQTAVVAKAAALKVSQDTMPVDYYGEVLTEDDIVFGAWDYATRTFTADANNRAAVLVNTARASERENRVSSFLLHLVGFPDFDVRTQAVFTTFRPACFREGFVAESIVDIQSNNSYFNGFCIHSNTAVHINNNNYWEEGTIVSMPNLDDIKLPQSGYEKNEGLQAALREGYFYMRLVNKLPTIIASLTTWDNEWQPDYINSAIVQSLSGASLLPTQVVSGRVHTRTCNNSNNTYTFNPGTYSNFVLVTNCKVEFMSGVKLENAIVANSNTNAKSISGSDYVDIGRDDNCAAGGGAQILTLGGVHFPANLGMFGGQIVAKGDVTFAARAGGMQGASIISGGKISGTSNMSMGLCGTGMEDNFEANYFRLAH